jgi:hypothetical protein
MVGAKWRALLDEDRVAEAVPEPCIIDGVGLL